MHVYNYVCYLVECYRSNCTGDSTVNMEAGFSALTERIRFVQFKTPHLK